MKHKINFLVLIGLLSAPSCAEKKTRIWIEPPLGHESSAKKKIYYQVEDIQSGKKENLMIPLEQTPENLIVEDRKIGKGEAGLGTATQADRMISDGKLSDKKTTSPTVSYLRGLQEVEDLFRKRAFSEALVKIAPLAEQYPNQTRVFAMQGTLFRKIGEKKLALKAYQRAFELDNENAELEDMIARLEDETGGSL